MTPEWATPNPPDLDDSDYPMGVEREVDVPDWDDRI
jgi:hypothetical protein